MITARNPIVPFWHTPAADKDGDTKFNIKGLTALERVSVQAGAEFGKDGAGDATVIWTERAIKSALKAGLIGWEGFNDSDGKPVKFSNDVLVNISRFDYALLNELFIEIMTASALDEGQAKN